MHTDLPRRTLDVTTIIDTANTLTAALSLATDDICAGVTHAGAVLTREARRAIYATAGIGHTDAVDAGLEESAADLGAGRDTLAVPAELSRLALGGRAGIR